MQTRTRALFFCLGLCSAGCHVLERADQCQTLATRINNARPALLGAKLPGDPSPEVLRKRASVYGRLGTELEGLTVTTKAVDDERRNVIGQLRALETHLNAAANAVQKEAEANKKRAGEPSAPNARIVPEAPTPSAPAPKDTAVPSSAPKATGLVGSDSTIVPRPTIVPPPRYSLHVREYTQAKRVAETAGRTLVSAIERLERECR